MIILVFATSCSCCGDALEVSVNLDKSSFPLLPILDCNIGLVAG